MTPRVAILAGGLATRLRPITEVIPKALVQIKGKPFIDYQLTLLSKMGFSEIVLCTGYKGEMIEDHLGRGEAFGLNIDYSHDGETLLGTGGALKKALPLLGERFIVLYGDSYLTTDYHKVIDFFDGQSSAGPLGLMTVFKNSKQFDTSNIVFREGKILVYDKKVITEDMEFIDWGLGILRTAAFSEFANRDVFDLAELYGSLLKRGVLLGFEVFQRFYEIGSPAGIKDFEEFITASV